MKSAPQIRFAQLVFNNGSGLHVCLNTKTLIHPHPSKVKDYTKKCDTGNNHMEKKPSEKCRSEKYKLRKCFAVHYKSGKKIPAVFTVR